MTERQVEESSDNPSFSLSTMVTAAYKKAKKAFRDRVINKIGKTSSLIFPETNDASEILERRFEDAETAKKILKEEIGITGIGRVTLHENVINYDDTFCKIKSIEAENGKNLGGPLERVHTGLQGIVNCISVRFAKKGKKWEIIRLKCGKPEPVESTSSHILERYFQYDLDAKKALRVMGIPDVDFVVLSIPDGRIVGISLEVRKTLIDAGKLHPLLGGVSGINEVKFNNNGQVVNISSPQEKALGGVEKIDQSLKGEFVTSITFNEDGSIRKLTIVKGGKEVEIIKDKRKGWDY